MTDKQKKYVLLIDDETILLHDWSRALKAQGYEVGLCSTTDQGFNACLLRWPDAIVIDAFFRDEDGKPTSSGGMLFCTQLSLYAYDAGLDLPFILGVTASRPTDLFPIDVFGQVSHKVMPVRMRKPFEIEALVSAIDKALAPSDASNAPGEASEAD